MLTRAQKIESKMALPHGGHSQLVNGLGGGGNSQDFDEGVASYFGLGNLTGRYADDFAIFPDHNRVIRCTPGLDEVADCVFERSFRLAWNTFFRSHFCILPV